MAMDRLIVLEESVNGLFNSSGELNRALDMIDDVLYDISAIIKDIKAVIAQERDK
jgi:hypothetical protein